jgi:glycerol-3-phosphate dehydrogenase
VIAREQAVEALSSEPFDVVVIGGGITGAGVALDAASRGYSVALVEKDDFASGTSSRSSKLVHGGLRYLQQFDLGLVREALLERQLMVALAPHLVRPLKLVVPAFEGARPERIMGVGLHMYDVLSLDRRRRRRRRRGGGEDGEEGDGSVDWSPERHRTISGEEVVELLPALAAREPSSGYLFYDCQTDDVRLVLTVLGEAERFGAICANGLEVVELVHGEAGGAAAGVVVEDRETGGRFTVQAANVVNATGVWADRIRPEELHDEAEVPTIRPSRGTHLTLARERLPLEAGAILPAGEGRTIFALPWLGSTLLGTTDNDYDGDIDDVRPPLDDVDYLLGAAGSFFGTELTHEDITGAYAGVRPLISRTDAKKSVDISRKAELYETSSGLITITGGKLTTWRRMAKLAVDRLVEREDREAPCRTHEIPLGLSVDADELPAIEGVPDESRAALAARYGHAAHDVLALAAERGELAQPIVPGHPDLLAEAVFAARREQARSVADVLLRRTRLGLLAARELSAPGPGAPERVAAVLGAERGWDDRRIAAEGQRFREAASGQALFPSDGEPASASAAGATDDEPGP